MADLTATDLLAPVGPITPTLFPGEDVNRLGARLDQYLAAAYADGRVVAIAAADASKRNTAARALALSVAFNDVFIRMSAEPITVNQFERGSHTYSAAQLANIQAISNDYLAELESMVPATDTVTPIGTTGVPTVFGW